MRFKTSLILFLSAFCYLLSQLIDNESRLYEVNKPNIEFIHPDVNQKKVWGSQVQYSLHVTDEIDGDSRYNEINPHEVFLRIDFLPGSKEMDDPKKIKKLRMNSVMGKASCFGCHADKTVMVGPSFSDIADRYDYSNKNKAVLAGSILNGSKGVWGNMEMPAYREFTEKQALNIADFILKQGAQKNSWVYSGLEGSFRIIEKPENIETGYYILTATYTSSAQLNNESSAVLKIKSE